MGKISGQQALEALDKWDAYITEYQTGLAEKKTQMEAILNSPTATQTEKNSARKTYEIQKAHLDELQFKRSQLQIQFDNDGEIDDTVPFGANGKMATFMYRTEENGTIYTGYARNAWPPNVFVSAQHFNLYFKTTGSWQLRVADQSPSVLQFGIQSPGSGVRMYQMKDLNHYSPDTSETTIYGGTAWFGVWVITGFNTGDVIPEGTQLYAHTFYGGIRVEMPNDTVPTESPWDYYNDDLEDLFDDPDIVVYPDGYTPPNPFDPPEEPVDVPDDDGEVPPDQLTRNVIGATRFVTQYALNYTELATVGNRLWSSWLTTNTDVWKNFFLPYAQDFGTLNIGAALDFIISLKVFPFAFTDEMSWIGLGDGVRMGTGHTDFLGADSRIIRTLLGYLNGGTCEIPQYYKDFRDIYNTTIIAYLPYCGTVQLNPSEVMGKTLQLYYYIDFQAGSCTAVIKVIGDNTTYNICAKSGQIGFTIPITATNAGQVAAQFIGDATQLFGTIGDYTMGVAKNIPKLATKKNMLSGVLGITENIGSAAASIIDEGLGIVSRSGVDVPMLSGGAGIESFKLPSKAYVQVRRGKYGKPSNYPHSKGFVNDSSGTISSFGESGTAFCVFTGVDTTGLKCNDAEKAEILSLLQSGVYV